MRDHSSEADARIIINDLLHQAGWDPSDKSQVLTEYVLQDRGRADYLLLSRSGRPLAIIEAKRSAIEPYTAKQQALPYAKQIGTPFIFLTNGELIYFWDYGNDDARIVNSFYSRREVYPIVKTKKRGS